MAGCVGTPPAARPRPGTGKGSMHLSESTEKTVLARVGQEPKKPATHRHRSTATLQAPETNTGQYRIRDIPAPDTNCYSLSPGRSCPSRSDRR